MSMKDVELRLKEMSESLKTWREEEKSKNDAWNQGYNDGFDDALKSLKEAFERGK